MIIINEQDVRYDSLRIIGQKMMVAARTAPKGKGIDNIEIALVEKDSIKVISDKLKELGEEYDMAGFKRDAENILLADVMLLLGTRKKSLGLKKCGMCGFENCGEKDKHRRRYENILLASFIISSIRQCCFVCKRCTNR